MTSWVPVAVAGAVIVAALTVTADVAHERPLLFQDDFDGRDGVITNHYAYYSPDDPAAHRSPKWEVQSGCALRDGNRLWTGVPTANLPNRDCSNGTGSAVFRMWTKRADFEDVAVAFALHHNRYTPDGESWDGVKIYLRRQDGDNFYTVEVDRREGNVIVQRKCDGRYALLGGTRTASTPPYAGEWEGVGGTVVNQPDGAVRLQVVRRDGVVLEVTDPPDTCDALREPGRIGVRGDRTDFQIDGLEVRGLAAR